MNEVQEITKHITANNNNVEVIKKHFSHCFDKKGQLDFEKLKKELTKNEIDFYKESYSLDWLGKSYARLLASDEATTLLKEDTAHNSKEENKNAQNLLLKGDNLEVLKHLANAYYQKIKMIYIDPPYNTGNDGFVYQDDRKFTVQQLQELAGISHEKAKRILAFTQSNSNSHSAWLTFMYPRLYIAKQLLKDDGVIFISIDDNEVAQLRLLMDEVFGEENFVGTIVWKHTEQSKNDEKFFSRHFNYHIVYKKSDEIECFSFPRTEENNKNYSNPDNDLNGCWRSGDVRSPHYRKTLCFNIISPSGNIIIPPTNGWRWSEKSIIEKIKTGEIIFNKDETKITRKIYLKNQKGRTPENLWRGDTYGTTRIANSEVKNLFEGEKIFDTPKPIQLIKKMMMLLSNEKKSIILDFFAGSGTTGDAVMQLNAEDGGNRQYILAQIAEPIDAKKSKVAYDFVTKLKTKNSTLKTESASIFDITKERLLRAAAKVNANIAAKTKDIEEKIEKLKGEIQTTANKQEIEELNQLKTKNLELKTKNVFKIFETIPIWENYEYDADKLEIEKRYLKGKKAKKKKKKKKKDTEAAPQQKEMIFDAKKLTEADIQTLLLTWKTADSVLLTENCRAIELCDYTGYLAQNKLYLMHKGFSTDSLKSLLEKIDSDKTFNPTTIVAFGYHFDSKHLREIAESVKSYRNKKEISIDFIIQY
ncbi:MAG: site-specific DNA-methyltransferase [Chitinophagales bacterium]